MAYAALMWLGIFVLTVVISLTVVVCGWLLAPFDRQRRVAHRLCGVWGESIFLAVPSWRLQIKGRARLDPRRRYILVANHQSLFDIMALFGLRRQFKWVAKDSLFRIPFLGWAMSAAKYVRLVRGERDSIRATYKQTKQWLASGISVLFFPEGTRSTTGEMLPFKNGAFKLAMELGVPVVPIAVDGTRNLLQRGSWLIQPRGVVRIDVLEPLDPASYRNQGPERFREDAQAAIQAALARLRRSFKASARA